MTTIQAAVCGRWFPADVMLPGRSMQWSRCYVLATDTELCIFTRVSEEPMWRSSIVRGTLPDTDQRARNGFDVHTEDGLVVVTLGSGCRCGSLGRWSGPSWGQMERASRWP